MTRQYSAQMRRAYEVLRVMVRARCSAQRRSTRRVILSALLMLDFRDALRRQPRRAYMPLTRYYARARLMCYGSAPRERYAILLSFTTRLRCLCYDFRRPTCFQRDAIDAYTPPRARSCRYAC